MHVVDPWTEATGIRRAIRRREQLIEQHRIDRRIVVEYEDEVGAFIERIANAEIVPSSVSEIALRLDNLDAVVRRVATDRIGGAVARGVVDHDDPSRGVLQTPQRCEAGLGINQTVPIQDDDPDRRKSHEL